MNFTMTTKKQWVEGIISREKTFTKKGKEKSPLIGMLVTVDFEKEFEHQDLLGGIHSLTHLSEKEQTYFNSQEVFISTDEAGGGHSSIVVLDYVYPVSIYRLKDHLTGKFLFSYK